MLCKFLNWRFWRIQNVFCDFNTLHLELFRFSILYVFLCLKVIKYVKTTTGELYTIASFGWKMWWGTNCGETNFVVEGGKKCNFWNVVLIFVVLEQRTMLVEHQECNVDVCYTTLFSVLKNCIWNLANTTFIGKQNLLHNSVTIRLI
jgi:hypothetical protein